MKAHFFALTLFYIKKKLYFCTLNKEHNGLERKFDASTAIFGSF